MSSEIENAVAKVQRGVRGFAEEMREQGIHVGLNRVCCTCGQSWPCEAERRLAVTQ